MNIDLKKYINLKIIRFLTVAMFFVASILVISVDIGRTSGNIRIIYVRDWVFGEFTLLENLLYWIVMILACISFVIFIIADVFLRKIQKQRDSGDELRSLLIATAGLMGGGIILEAIYLFFHSDLSAAWEVIAQFYITLNTMALVTYISITILLFIDDNVLKNPVFAVFVLVINYGCLFCGYIMMILFGLFPEGFSIGNYIAVGLTAIVAIMAFAVTLKIWGLRKRIEKNKNALTFIAIQLILIVAAIGFLIACGLTYVAPGVVSIPNRVFRLVRMATLFVAAISYFPAYILPSMKKGNRIKADTSNSD